MKFISKSSNLNIVLRPGMSAQPLTGTPAVATIFVKFTDGIAEVGDKELIEMMLTHNGFNRDFVSADEKGTDPYVHIRESSEVQYVTEELIHGQTKRTSSPIKKTLPPEIQKMIKEQAMSIAKEMLPTMVEAVLKEATSKDVSKEKDTPVRIVETAVEPTVEESIKKLPVKRVKMKSTKVKTKVS